MGEGTQGDGMPLFSQPILRALSIPGKVLQRAGSNTSCSSTSRSSSAFRVQCEVSGQHLRADSVCFPVVTDEVTNPEGLRASNSRPRMESTLSTVQDAFRHRGHCWKTKPQVAFTQDLLAVSSTSYLDGSETPGVASSFRVDRICSW